MEFIENYDDMVENAGIFDDAILILDEFRSRGYTQMILSAMQNEFLQKLVIHHGIEHYFDTISGIDNHYASGKVDNARNLISGLREPTGEIIMIGDTVHDHEVGEELGVRVILVCRGHQSEDRLRSTGRETVHNFKDLVEIIKK